MSSTIAIMTDFGTLDPYVGIMKGVMLSRFPQATFVDLTHEVSPQNIHQAAFLLLNSYWVFPKDTVFLVVIDPGVGSDRKAVAVQTDQHYFVAPDNGVLSLVLDQSPPQKIINLTNADYHLPNAGNTFHGRDIFSPVAATLAQGNVLIGELGEDMDALVELPTSDFTQNGTDVIGQIVHIDHFGNCITNIGSVRWENKHLILDETVLFSAKRTITTIAGFDIIGINRTFADTEIGAIATQVDSYGYLGVIMRDGSAANTLGLRVGDTVRVKLHLL